jgi:phage nucleotide-binding protein
VKKAQSRVRSASQSFDWAKILVYGNNGKGKTRFGASGPRKVLLVDCNEKGSLSVRNYEGVDVFAIETWADIDLAFWMLKSGNHDYQTVAIDTVTSLAQLCMKFVLGDEASRDPTKDPNMPGRREWGKVGELMRTTILNFRNLPMHVVFLAQERRGFNDDDDDDSTPDVFPEVSPSVRTTLTAAVDIIGRVYVKEVVGKGEKKGETAYEYRLLIGPSERYLTKDRSEAGLPTTIRLPDAHDNLDKLVQRIKKGV